MRKFLAVVLAILVVPCVVYAIGYSGRGSKTEIDGATNALRMIEYEHHQVHSGSFFKLHYTNTTASSDNHRSVVAFITPASTKWGHLTVTVTASHPAEFFLSEAATLNVDTGTDSTIINRNRNNATQSVMTTNETAPEANEMSVYIEGELATFVAGIELEYEVLVGGEGPKAVGGTTRSEQEWVLKSGTKYVVMLKNTASNANVHEIQLNWYEHVDL